MRSPGTGEGGFPVLRSGPNAALYALELILVAAAYAALAALPLLAPAFNPTATPVWPPAAVALALFLLLGYRIWPAILLGSFFFAATTARSLAEPGLAALGMLAAAAAGAWLLNRWSD